MLLEKKSKDELINLLTQALRRHPECEDVVIEDISKTTGGGALTWEAELVAAPGKQMSSHCKRIALTAIHDFQIRFDLI
jgi:hypothetical protein